MKADFTMPYTESQITFQLSGYEHFAFENCPGYQRRSAHQLGEMDLGWYEPTNQSLYVAELKDYHVWLQADQPSTGTRVVDLFHKSLSVIAMLTAVRAGETGADIATCLPTSWFPANPVYLLHIIHCNADDEVKLSFMKDKLREYMRPQYLQLFNIESCTILSHRQAIAQFPQIIS